MFGKGGRWGTSVLGLLCLMCLIALLLPADAVSRTAGRRMRCMMNLKDISLALLNYHTANGCFPPAVVVGKDGKPMHSWRVLLLPYLEQRDLYEAYDFQEPWDGPKNKRLLAACPAVYQCSNAPDAFAPNPAEANFLAIVGPTAAWSGQKPRKLADFVAGTSATPCLSRWTTPESHGPSRTTCSSIGGLPVPQSQRR